MEIINHKKVVIKSVEQFINEITEDDSIRLVKIDGKEKEFMLVKIQERSGKYTVFFNNIDTFKTSSIKKVREHILNEIKIKISNGFRFDKLIEDTFLLPENNKDVIGKMIDENLKLNIVSVNESYNLNVVENGTSKKLVKILPRYTSDYKVLFTFEINDNDFKEIVKNFKKKSKLEILLKPLWGIVQNEGC